MIALKTPLDTLNTVTLLIMALQFYTKKKKRYRSVVSTGSEFPFLSQNVYKSRICSAFVEIRSRLELSV